MLGGGFVGGPHHPALKQTAAERRRSRTTTTSHTDGDAPAIRTLWEGGPSECWGEGFFEKPSRSHGYCGLTGILNSSIQSSPCCWSMTHVETVTFEPMSAADA